MASCRIPISAQNLTRILEDAAKVLGVEATALKNQQIEAIISVLEGKDTFVNLPTGFGKSLIYQVLPLCYGRYSRSHVRDRPTTTTIGTGSATVSTVEGLVIVLSPLTSLISDQISLLKNCGIPAINLAALSFEEKRNVEEKFCGIAFASPELLLGTGSDFMKSSNVQRSLIGICVDESHCVVKWGEHSKEFAAFRESYGRISELRSLVPRLVPMIALTATSSLHVRTQILTSLGMCSPTMIMESPEKNNIRYSHIRTSLPEEPAVLKPLADELLLLGIDIPRTIVFCRTHRQVRSFYSYFRSILPSERMTSVAMYHSTTDESRKAVVSASFQEEDGLIRILFCTIAFGMGVNVRGVTRVIHYGPPEGIDDYVQESGRAGRGGEQSYAILISYSGCTRHKISAEMKDYLHNTSTCRRKQLLQPFGYDVEGHVVSHFCCDSCASKCDCADGSCAHEHAGASSIERSLKSVVAAKLPDKKRVVREVNKEQLSLLREKLTDYRAKLLPEEVYTTEMLCGKDVVSGFPLIAIDWIVRDAMYIDSAGFFHERYPLFHSKYSEEVWEVVCSAVGPQTEPVNPIEDETCDTDIRIDSGTSSDSSLDDTVDSTRYRAVLLYSSDSD